VVAIDTTPEIQAEAPQDRMQSLNRWKKRTQEVLAHRSLQGRKFHRLYNLLRTKRLIEVSLDKVLRNDGAKTAGVDGVSKADLKTEEAQKQLTEEIYREMKGMTYQPKPVRRVYIPKANGGERPLGIPTIKDRVVQEMLRAILEPIYEAKFYEHSYGFRPFRSTHHAAMRLKDLIGRRGYNIAIEGDIRKCFDRIHHQKLLQILRRTIQDERILHLIRDLLKAGVMEDGAWHITDEGTPQGGIVSPLLANIYLNELDQFIAKKWSNLSDVERNRRKRHSVALPCFIVRYADDFVVTITGTPEQAEQLKIEIANFLKTELHLELSEEKTLVTAVEKGFDFLGFTIRKYRQVTLITPSRKAMEKFRQKVKQKVWDGFSKDDASGIEHLNRFLIGWGMYYRRVSSTRDFRNADSFVWWRVFRTTHRLRNPKLHFGKHYKAHYIPYRYDIRTKNRWRKGRNYGAWADEAHTTAYIVVRLSFIPIRYARFYSQLNPFVREDRDILEKREPLDLHPDELPEPRYNPEYGMEWATLRRAVLEMAGHRCQCCGKNLKLDQTHVHHQVRRKGYKHRRRANLLENLIALCPTCHAKVERQTAI
jgi:group II intron reverse transcriptase/maturase